jgi:formylglycine-generating enzyme required for sulfatase activity
VSYPRSLAARLQWCDLPGIAANSPERLSLAAIVITRTLLLADGQHSNPSARAQPLMLDDLLASQERHVLLLAGPAEGKSLALHRLARACIAGDELAGEPLAIWQDVPPMPLLLNLAALRPDERHVSGDEPASRGPSFHAAPDGLPPLILEQLARDDLLAFAPEVEDALRAGNCLVLLDDCTTPERAAVVASLAQAFPGNRFIAAGPPEMAIDGFTPYLLQPLDKPQLNTMVDQWCVALASPSDDPTVRAARLQGQLLLDDGLLALVSWPVALALAILADHAGLPLPQRRADVYARLVELLLEKRNSPPRALATPALGNASASLDLLASLALTLLEQANNPQNPPGIVRQRAIAATHAALVNPGRPGDEGLAELFLERLMHAGLLGSGEHPGTVTIPRRALREYLAARALAARQLPASRAADPRWHPVIRLAIGEQARRSPETSFKHIQSLLDGDYAAKLLAAECLYDLEAATSRAPQLVRYAREQLLATLRDGRCPLPERIRAGRLLGELGDPRFDDLAPPLARVEGSVFVLGATSPGFDDEGPPQRIDVPGFQIGVYLVTNREYARFLADAPEYPRPHYWFDPRFNNPSLPVVGVTWHDAEAYCGWLTEQLAQRGQLPAGNVARLPLEAEWEKAATWGPHATQKRAFPWGDAWDPARANLAEGRREWLTTPVGCYPTGVSRYGLHDMVGNVWEWTASTYLSYPGARQPFHTSAHYVLRGSSCVSLPTNARATYRGSHLPPHYWRYHLGFRVVIGRPAS